MRSSGNLAEPFPVRRARRPRWLPWIVLLIALSGAVVFRESWLGALGRFLVLAEAPRKADAILVLAGDWNGLRILRGAELARQGYAPQVFVSGPKHHYGLFEYELAIPFAVRHGYPASMFVPLPLIGANSTREEAAAILPDLRRRGIRSLLVVTSDYHTRRATRVYRELAADLDAHVVAARDANFSPGAWWKGRNGRKVFLLEWTKTITSIFGI